jgi:small-conductance mechanosensitive channel
LFDPQLNSTGREYTTMVALLVIAFIFIPVLLLVSSPSGYFMLSLAISASAICVVLAWVSWKKSSQVRVPSIGTPRADPK